MFGPYRYGTLQFSSFDEIRDVGYYHGKTYFSGMFHLLPVLFTTEVLNF